MSSDEAFPIVWWIECHGDELTDEKEKRRWSSDNGDGSFEIVGEIDIHELVVLFQLRGQSAIQTMYVE